MDIKNCDAVTLFDICWEDVLFEKLIPLLSLKDLFTLRCCSKTCKEFVNRSFQYRTQINLAENNSLNKLPFKVLAENCRRLKHLNLAKCSWVTDRLLISLLKHNKNLEYVNLNECLSVSSAAIQPIIIECKMLKVLKLSKCQWVTAGSIDALTLHHNALEEFNISHCSTIGERCLIILFRKLNNLMILSLAFTPSVTDNVLRNIGRYCKLLIHINLRGCDKISALGIEALITQCTKLQSIEIQNGPAITDRVLTLVHGRALIENFHRYDIYERNLYLIN